MGQLIIHGFVSADGFAADTNNEFTFCEWWRSPASPQPCCWGCRVASPVVVSGSLAAIAQWATGRGTTGPPHSTTAAWPPRCRPRLRGSRLR
jgi:hypothetical protein